MGRIDDFPEPESNIADSAKDTLWSGPQIGSMKFGEQLLNLLESHPMMPLFDQVIQVATDGREHYRSVNGPLEEMAVVAAFLTGMYEWILQNMEQLPEWLEKAIMVEMKSRAENN